MRLPSWIALPPCLLTVLLAAPSTLCPAAAQEPPANEQAPAGRFGEAVEVTEVFLDVVAVDRKGKIVPDLTAADFVVREDGEPVEITSVDFYTTRYEDLEPKAGGRPGKEPETAAPPAEVPSARYFILFFHDQTGEAENQSDFTRNLLDSARSARQWVRREMQPSDWVAVVRFEQSLSVQTDFTQDQKQIEQAIEDAVVDRPSSVNRPSERRRREAVDAPTLLRELPRSLELPKYVDRVEDAIRLVAEASGGIVGRKNLILFSLGFGQLGSEFRLPDSRYYPPMKEALNANNVAIYPIDLAGPRVDTPQTAFLSLLADETGGELFKTFHSYSEPFRRIGSQTTGYYLITFRSEHPAGATGYQKIEVDTRRRGIQIRARGGYRYGRR